MHLYPMPPGNAEMPLRIDITSTIIVSNDARAYWVGDFMYMSDDQKCTGSEDLIVSTSNPVLVV